jgi:hypothetical protein
MAELAAALGDQAYSHRPAKLTIRHPAENAVTESPPLLVSAQLPRGAAGAEPRDLCTLFGAFLL